MTINKTKIFFGSVLFLSLVGNMFMGGLLFGNSYRAWHPEKREELRQNLSDADRKIVRHEMAAQRPAFNSLRKQLDEAREKIEEALQANDSEALDQALKEEKLAKEEILKLIQSSRQSAMQKMSAEGKNALQDIIDANAIRVSFLQNSSGQDMDLPPDLGGPDEPDMP